MLPEFIHIMCLQAPAFVWEQNGRMAERKGIIITVYIFASRRVRLPLLPLQYSMSYSPAERRTLMNRDWVPLLPTAIAKLFDLLQQNA